MTSISTIDPLYLTNNHTITHNTTNHGDSMYKYTTNDTQEIKFKNMSPISLQLKWWAYTCSVHEIHLLVMIKIPNNIWGTVSRINRWILLFYTIYPSIDQVHVMSPNCTRGQQGAPTSATKDLGGAFIKKLPKWLYS